jgi:hypothetical protein
VSGCPGREEKEMWLLGFLWFRVSCGFFSNVSKINPPFKNQCSLVFIGKVLLGFQTSPSTFPFLLFSSFFVNFDFSYFFVFLKVSKYQHRLNVENQ